MPSVGLFNNCPFPWLGKSDSEDGKQKVAEIHTLKEKLKQESENLKKIKQQLKDVQEKQKVEKEVGDISNSKTLFVNRRINNTAALIKSFAKKLFLSSFIKMT